MNETERNRGSHDAAESVTPIAAKKPYVKPAFAWERAFETMALSCGKVNSSQAQCKTNKKHS